jgi:hypothetical protein
MSSDTHAPQLSAAASSFQIGHRTLKIEDTIHSIRTKVIEKRKMVETFGAQYENGRTEEEFFWKESTRRVCKKYRVNWTDPNYPYELEMELVFYYSKICPKFNLKNS